MTDRVSLTEDYLKRVKASGATARELIGRMPESKQLTTFYGNDFLSRPLFLGHQEKVRLEHDMRVWHDAVESLPDRLFDGDLGAFARAVGMTEVQVSAVLKGRGERMTRQSRADLYCTEDGEFKMLECNLGSALGGMDNGDMAAALLEHPVLAEFAAEHRLGYVDTTEVQVANTLLESGYARTDKPVVALADWPTSYQTLESYNRLLCERWGRYGLEAYACHIGELEVRDRRVRLDGRPIDLVVRCFMIEDILESPEAPALMAPVLEAAEAGWVRIFTPMETEAFTSKGALAMLSDERNRNLFSAAELESLDRLLPWTRMVRDDKVTLEDGSRVDLLGYALDHRESLALKPTLSYGGRGVVLGWDQKVTAAQWEQEVRSALDGPYLLQRRVDPAIEYFLDPQGEWTPWLVSWGVFNGVDGFGGCLARAVPVSSGVGVINVSGGALASSLLYELPPED
ncbi:glutathionylspermidine synthase family protein [Kitasatospora acidiphila]|uniref:Glutathionylspermidine synthase family protein n=1 Tax=Kitasatospora acidiphila TaxID=2567942 RepID=A0A540WFK7_9ACTN|nr:glutathionylspermidine synthase family protein [Kitasatospora acidiphila]